jgi:hypothetical protein
MSKTQLYYIAGLIVENGIFDWTPTASTFPPSEDSAYHPKLIQNFSKSWTGTHLHALKSHLFSSPASTFDSFISPILFFRTSGVHVPKTWPSDPAHPESQSTTVSVDDKYLHYSMQTEHAGYVDDDESFTHSYSDTNAENLDPLTTKKDGQGITSTTIDLKPERKSHLKFPPKNSDLKLPRSLFLYSTSPSAPKTPIIKNGKRKTSKNKIRDLELDNFVTPQEQAEEMADLMRRSVVTNELRERKMWDEDVDPEAEASSRVMVKEIGEKGVDVEVGEWIEEAVGN